MTTVSNYYRIEISPNTQQINIPIQIEFDNLGKEQGYVEFEDDAIEQVINPVQDFEVTRFAHSFWDNSTTNTDINYNFYFFDDTVRVTATTNNDNWVMQYSGAGFTNEEIYYFANSFTKSFFKLDFYDNNQSENQKLYFTVVIPTQQGLKANVPVGLTSRTQNLPVNIPNYRLDYVGDKEGFFMYWLKNTDYLNVNEFYMSAKFFNAKTGEFVRLTNESQGVMSEKFTFNKDYKFYYKCILDYTNYEYKIYYEDVNGNLIRKGTVNDPIKWYEYVNP